MMIIIIVEAFCIALLILLLLSSWGHSSALRAECAKAYIRLYKRCEELRLVRLSRTDIRRPFKADPWGVEKMLVSPYAREFLDVAEKFPHTFHAEKEGDHAET